MRGARVGRLILGKNRDHRVRHAPTNRRGTRATRSHAEGPLRSAQPLPTAWCCRFRQAKPLLHHPPAAFLRAAVPSDRQFVTRPGCSRYDSWTTECGRTYGRGVLVEEAVGHPRPRREVRQKPHALGFGRTPYGTRPTVRRKQRRGAAPRSRRRAGCRRELDAEFARRDAQTGEPSSSTRAHLRAHPVCGVSRDTDGEPPAGGPRHRARKRSAGARRLPRPERDIHAITTCCSQREGEDPRGPNTRAIRVRARWTMRSPRRDAASLTGPWACRSRAVTGSAARRADPAVCRMERHARRVAWHGSHRRDT